MQMARPGSCVNPFPGVWESLCSDWPGSVQEPGVRKRVSSTEPKGIRVGAG